LDPTACHCTSNQKPQPAFTAPVKAIVYASNQRSTTDELAFCTLLIVQPQPGKGSLPEDLPTGTPLDTAAMASTKNDKLREVATGFCAAFLSPPPPSELLEKYFTSNNPKITEHGPEWARERLPFLAKTFSGKDGCEEYFKLMGGTLEVSLDDDAFPDAKGFVVNADANAVTVVGKGRFTSRKTGNGWDEQFIHKFSEFDEHGKIGHWEIWADPLSAWVAVGE
jgi:hypothetical protein